MAIWTQINTKRVVVMMLHQYDHGHSYKGGGGGEETLRTNKRKLSNYYSIITSGQSIIVSVIKSSLFCPVAV